MMMIGHEHRSIRTTTTADQTNIDNFDLVQPIAPEVAERQVLVVVVASRRLALSQISTEHNGSIHRPQNQDQQVIANSELQSHSFKSTAYIRDEHAYGQTRVKLSPEQAHTT